MASVPGNEYFSGFMFLPTEIQPSKKRISFLPQLKASVMQSSESRSTCGAKTHFVRAMQTNAMKNPHIQATPFITTKWVIETTFALGWDSAATERMSLPVALDLCILYDQCRRHHLPLPARPQETLRDHVTHFLTLEAKQRESAQFEVRLKREKQSTPTCALSLRKSPALH
jgi:hypothetical protein